MANFKKCQFEVSSIEYLGHIVSTKGVAANLAKVEAIWIPRVDRVLLEVHDQLRIHSIAIYTVT